MPKLHPASHSASHFGVMPPQPTSMVVGRTSSARAPINFGSSIALSPADLLGNTVTAVGSDSNNIGGFITSSGPADPRLYIRSSQTVVDQLGFESNVFIILTPVQVKQQLALEKQQQRKFMAVTGATTLGNEFGLDQENSGGGGVEGSLTEATALGQRRIHPKGQGQGMPMSDSIGGVNTQEPSLMATSKNITSPNAAVTPSGGVDDANGIGQPVTYGSKFCLMHKQSGMLVALLSTQPSAIDSNCFVISLVPSFETSSSAHFKFTPRYKFHSDGDPVYGGDQVVMQLFNRPVFMHLSRAATLLTLPQQQSSQPNTGGSSTAPAAVKNEQTPTAVAPGGLPKSGLTLNVPLGNGGRSRGSSLISNHSHKSVGVGSKLARSNSSSSFMLPLQQTYRQGEVNGSERSTSWIVHRYDATADDVSYIKSTARVGKLGLLTGTPLALFHREMEMVVTTADLSAVTTENLLAAGAASQKDDAGNASPVMVLGKEAFGSGDTLKPPIFSFGGAGSRSVSRLGDSNASVPPTPRSPHLGGGGGGSPLSASHAAMFVATGSGGGGALPPLASSLGTSIILGEAGLSSEDFNFLTLQCRCTALWILEAADPRFGGPVRTRTRYRIRQAATNKYLSVTVSNMVAEFGATYTAQPQLQLVPQPRIDEELSRSLFSVHLAVDDGSQGGTYVTQSDFLRIQHCETGAWIGTTRGGSDGGVENCFPAVTDEDPLNPATGLHDAANDDGALTNNNSVGSITFLTLMPRWQPHDALLAGHVIGHLQRSVLHLYRFTETLERCRDYFAATRSTDLGGSYVQHVLRGATDALVALISFCSDSENDNALDREGLPIRHHQQMLFDLHLHRLLVEVIVAPFTGKVDHMPELELRGGAFDLKSVKNPDKEPLFDLLRLCIRLLKQMIKGAPDLAARISDYIPLMYAFEGLKLHVADTVIEFFGENQLLPFELKAASIEHYIGMLTNRRSAGYLRILSALATDSLYRSIICEQLVVRNPHLLARFEIIDGDLCIINAYGSSAAAAAVAGYGPTNLSAGTSNSVHFLKFLQQSESKNVRLFEAQIELFGQLTKGSTDFVVDKIGPLLTVEQCEWILHNALWGYDDSVLAFGVFDVTRAHFIDIALNLLVLPKLRIPSIQLRAGIPLLASSKHRHNCPTHSGVPDSNLVKTLKQVCKRILKDNPFQVMENRRRNILLKSCVTAWKRLVEHWQYTEEELTDVLPMLINVLDGSQDTKTLKRALLRSEVSSRRHDSVPPASSSSTGAGGWNRHKLTEDGFLAFQVMEAAIETLHLLLDNMAHIKANQIIAQASTATSLTIYEERLELVEEANAQIIEMFDTPRLFKLLMDIARYEMQSLSRKALDLIAHLGFVRQMVYDRITWAPVKRDRHLTEFFDDCFLAADSLVTQVNHLVAEVANNATAGGISPCSAKNGHESGNNNSNNDGEGGSAIAIGGIAASSPHEYYAVRRRALSEGPDFSMFPATPRGRSYESVAASLGISKGVVEDLIRSQAQQQSGMPEHNPGLPRGGPSLSSTLNNTNAAFASSRPRSISEVYHGAPYLKAAVAKVLDLMDRGCGGNNSQELAAKIIAHWGIHLTMLRLLTRIPVEDPIYPLIIRFFHRFTQVEENARKLIKHTDVFLAGVHHSTAHNDSLRIIVAIMTSNAASNSRAEMDMSLVSKIEQMIVAEKDSDSPDGSLLEMINKSCASEALPFKFLRELVEGLHQRNVFSIVREVSTRWSMAKLQFVSDLLSLLNHYAGHSPQARNAVNKIITPDTIIRVLLQKNSSNVNGTKGTSGRNSGVSTPLTPQAGGSSSADYSAVGAAAGPSASSRLAHRHSHSDSFIRQSTLYGSSSAPHLSLSLTIRGPLFKLLTSLWAFEDESSYEMQRIRTQWTNSSDWWLLLSSVREEILLVANGPERALSSAAGGGDGGAALEKFLTSHVMPAVGMFYRNCMQVTLAGRRQELSSVTKDLCSAIRDAVNQRPSAFSSASVYDCVTILSDICEQMDMKHVSKYLNDARGKILAARRAAEDARQATMMSNTHMPQGRATPQGPTSNGGDDDFDRGEDLSYYDEDSYYGSASATSVNAPLPESLEQCCVTQEPILSFVRMLQSAQLRPSYEGDDFMIKTMTLLKRGELSMVTTVSLVKIFRQVLSDCEETDMVTLQDNLDFLGLMRVATSLSESKDDIVLEAAYRLGIALLEGGNTRVQNRMLEYFETHDEKFFANVRTTLDRCKQAIVDFRKKGSTAFIMMMTFMPAAHHGGSSGKNKPRPSPSYHSSKTSISARKSSQVDTVLKLTRLAFRFLQLLCEGHHLGMQNYMRDQLDNLHSINMVSEVTLLMRELCGATDTGATIGSKLDDTLELGRSRNVTQRTAASPSSPRLAGAEGERFLDRGSGSSSDTDAGRDARLKTQALLRLLPVINAGFALLTEVCQGPCPANQAALVAHSISSMITHGFAVQPTDERLFLAASGGEACSDSKSEDTDEDEKGEDGDGSNGKNGDEGNDEDEENLTPQELLLQLRARASTTLLAILEGCTDARTYGVVASQVSLTTIGNLLEHMMLERSQEQIVNQIENDDVTETVFNLLIFLIQVRPFGTPEYAIAITELLSKYQHLSKYLGSVEIQRESRLENVFFRVPRLCMALSDLTKDVLLWSVDRSNRSTKLADFVQQADEILYGMEVTHTFENRVLSYTRFAIKGHGNGIDHTEAGPILRLHKIIRQVLPAHLGERLMIGWNQVVPYVFTHKLEYYEKLFLTVAIIVNVSLLVFGKKLDPAEVDAASDLDSPAMFNDDATNTGSKSESTASTPEASLDLNGAAKPKPGEWANISVSEGSGSASTEDNQVLLDGTIPQSDESTLSAASTFASAVVSSVGKADVHLPNPFTFAEGRTMGIPTWLFSVAGLFQLFFTVGILIIDSCVLLPTDIYRIKKRRERRNDAKADKKQHHSTGKQHSAPDTNGETQPISAVLTVVTTPSKLLTLVASSNTWAIATRIQTIYRVMMVLFSLLSFTVSPLFCAAFLIALIHQSSVLMNVIVAITQNGRSLLLTMGLGVVMVYLFAIVGFTTFPSSFGEREEGGEPNCDSFGRCFAFILVHGLRQGGGVGDIMKDMPWSSKGLIPRMGYDFLFFALLNVVFLNILFGIIIDAFAELRDDKRTKEEDMHGTCYICGTQAEEFEKHGVSFLWHVQKEHNMWQYLYLMYHLRTKDPNEYTGQESYVQNLLDKGSLAFFPEETSLALQTKLLHMQLMNTSASAHNDADGAEGDTDANASGLGAEEKDIALITQLIAAMQESSISSSPTAGLAELRYELAASSQRRGGYKSSHYRGDGATENGDDDDDATSSVMVSALGGRGGGGGGRNGGSVGAGTTTLTMLMSELAAAHRLCERLHISLAESSNQVRTLEKQVRKHEATIAALTDFFKNDIPVVWHDALKEIIEAREGRKVTGITPVAYIEEKRRELEDVKRRRREARALRVEEEEFKKKSRALMTNSPATAKGDNKEQSATTRTTPRRDRACSTEHKEKKIRENTPKRTSSRTTPSRKLTGTNKETSLANDVIGKPQPFEVGKPNQSEFTDHHLQQSIPLISVTADHSPQIKRDARTAIPTRERDAKESRADGSVIQIHNSAPAAVASTPSLSAAQLTRRPPLREQEPAAGDNNTNGYHSSSSSSHRSHISTMDIELEFDENDGHRRRNHHHHRNRSASGAKSGKQKGAESSMFLSVGKR